MKLTIRYGICVITNSGLLKKRAIEQTIKVNQCNEAKLLSSNY